MAGRSQRPNLSGNRVIGGTSPHRSSFGREQREIRDAIRVERRLDRRETPYGGLVDVIFEGTDFQGTLHRQVIATLAPSAGVISLPEPEPDGSHLCFYDGNGDGIPDRDVDGERPGAVEETIGCLKSQHLAAEPGPAPC